IIPIVHDKVKMASPAISIGKLGIIICIDIAELPRPPKASHHDIMETTARTSSSRRDPFLSISPSIPVFPLASNVIENRNSFFLLDPDLNVLCVQSELP